MDPFDEVSETVIIPDHCHLSWLASHSLSQRIQACPRLLAKRGKWKVLFSPFLKIEYMRSRY